MTLPHDKAKLVGSGEPSWENEGGSVAAQHPPRDLNSLLAQEQTSIMNAEAAVAPGLYEMHRDASRQTRELINATPYPEHEAHVFDQERADKLLVAGEEASDATRRAEANERSFAKQFSTGKVSAKSFQSRTRFLRQERARLSELNGSKGLEKTS